MVLENLPLRMVANDMCVDEAAQIEFFRSELGELRHPCKGGVEDGGYVLLKGS